MLSKQEIYHSIVELLLGLCSHHLIKLNFLNDFSMLEIDEFYNNNASPTKLSVAGTYSERISKNVWLTEERYDSRTQNSREIALFYVRKHRARKYKTYKHMKNNAVAVFSKILF